MLDALQLLQKAPALTRMGTQLVRAANGDPQALAYLKGEGLYEGLDVLRPGAGESARQVVQQLRDTALGIQSTLAGDIVEGEYEVLEEGEVGYPWSGFLRRLIKQRFGGHILLGPMGQGKTSLALKLAWHWRALHGYRVECVELYGDDRPEWAVTLGTRTLVRRMQQLKKYLDSQSVDDELAGLEEDEEEDDGIPATLPPIRRVIIIDEAGMAMESNAANPVRKAALRALAQCRHLDWVVLYLGQMAGQIPLPLLGQSTVWVKQPNGREIYTDRDNPIVRDLWERATAAFAQLKGSSHYTPPHADPRAWAYCDCPSLNGMARGYTGLVPFTPAPRVDEEGEFEEEE